jgi:gamma-glutamyl-gamma-aminobutyrate hydrolase PuuD
MQSEGEDAGRRPLIGLTVGPRCEPDGFEYARLRMTYVRAIELTGGVPVIVPALAEPGALGAVLARLDGLLLPGGADLHPATYGEPINGARSPNPELDRLELAAARWAIERDLPTLGICRGQQVINVALGGSLIQHLDGHAPTGPRDQRHHPFRVAPASRLAGVLGSTELEVNSHHHQAVKALGEGLVAVAWAPDGTIEGLERPAARWLLAVQFHPEDLVGEHEASQRLFAAFVSACRAGAPAPAQTGR